MRIHLLDSSVLQSLFGGEKSARGHSETPSSTVENSDRTSNVAALLALSFFVNEKLEIEEFAKLPLTTDEKFLNDQQKFIKKESESQFLFLKQLNITLSPQQHRILTQNKKLLLLVGEPGAGKTVLLLAKAFVAATDPSIESIFYYAPAVKTALKEDVLKFVQYPEYEELFSKKFKYLSDEELFNLESKSFRHLQETILLIDEIYFEAYDERKQKHGANFSQNFFQLSQKVFPYLRNCWMANIVASGLSEDFEIMSKFFNHQFFSIQPLSVQYRSSSHIGTFSTNYLHESRQIGWSSVRVPGSFMSSQTEVSIRIYDHRDALEISAFDDNLNDDRWAIVFCETSEVSAWECKIRKSGKFSRKFVASSSIGCHECQFSGGESISVAIYLDHIPSEDPEQIFPVLNLAITRAQSHLTIHVKKEFYPRMENFFQLKDQNEKQMALMDARAGLPIDFSNINLEKMPEFVNKLYAVAYAKSDRKLLIELRRQFGYHPLTAEFLVGNMKGWKDKKFLETSVGRKKSIREFWEKELQTLENSNQTCSLLGTIIHAIDISCIALLECIFNLMGDKNMGRLLCQFPPTLLFQSCFKGSRPMMEYILKQLRKFDMVQREMECIYSLWGEETTLLTLLCYGNQTADVVKLILNRGFPDQLLLHPFLGKNALQFAMEHNNVETVKCLLARKDKSTKKPILLTPSVKLCGISPVEYAQQLGFEEIVDCVSKF